MKQKNDMFEPESQKIDNGMLFEKQNKSVRNKWFKYELITAVLTITGLLALCVQKYISIYTLKTECLEKGLDFCADRMYINRYQHNNKYAWAVICLNIPSLVTYCLGHWYH